MGGKPCIRGMRVTVGTILGLLASGHSEKEILDAYPYLETKDVHASLSYAAWRLEEIEVQISRLRFLTAITDTLPIGLDTA